jgi:hypothetical protein
MYSIGLGSNAWKTATMTDTKPERRKNPARKKTVDVGYEVRWNGERRTFDIYRANVKTGGFARDRSTAIGLARRDAEAEPPGRTVTVSYLMDGELKVEWSSWK